MPVVQISLFILGSLLALASPAADSEEEVDDIELLEADARPYDDDVTFETGFVFIDGEFVPPPYTVTLSEDENDVLINERAIPGAIPESRFRTGPFSGRSAPREETSRRRRGFGWQNWSTPPPRRMWAARIRQYLDHDAAIVAFSGERLATLRQAQTYALLRSLLDPQQLSANVDELMEIPIGPEAAALWQKWLLEFRPDAEFRRHAEPHLAAFEAAEAANLAQVAAVRRFDAVAYPLTLLGMLMSVVAFGHLLMSLPNNDAMRRKGEGEGGISAEVIRATIISVLLVAALSSLDLVWTLLASQAGQMRELNPIASHFIEDPLSLIAFKATATLLGCGLLYALRRHSRAQLASWWMCLVCTMLTFRWLVFNSMFVS